MDNAYAIDGFSNSLDDYPRTKASGGPEIVTPDVTTVDEDGKPVSAVLGVVAVDDAVLALADDEDTAPLPMHFLLGLEVEELERTELFAEGAGSGRAVDLLLGTQGWRRFAWRDRDAFVAAHPETGPRVLPGRLAAAGLFTVDNLEEARSAVRRDLTDANERAAVVGMFLLVAAILIGSVYGFYRFWRWALRSTGLHPAAAAVCGSLSTVVAVLFLMMFLTMGTMTSMAPELEAWITDSAVPVESEVTDLVNLDDVTNGLLDLEGLLRVDVSVSDFDGFRFFHFNAETYSEGFFLEWNVPGGHYSDSDMLSANFLDIAFLDVHFRGNL